MPEANAFLFMEFETRDVDRALESLALGTSPRALANFLGSVGVEWLQGRAARRFATAGDSATGPWAELTETTQRLRRESGFPPAKPINAVTGEMLKFITDDRGSTYMGAESAWLIWPNTPTGPMFDKVRTAQQGVAVGENEMFPNAATPARPIMAMDEGDLVGMLSLLATHIEDVMSGRGFTFGALS